MMGAGGSGKEDGVAPLGTGLHDGGREACNADMEMKGAERRRRRRRRTVWGGGGKGAWGQAAQLSERRAL